MIPATRTCVLLLQKRVAKLYKQCCGGSSRPSMGSCRESYKPPFFFPRPRPHIPYSGYFSRENIFVKVVILAISWKKNFVVARFASYFGRAHAVFFVGKYFVVRLPTTKTTKILPPKKFPLYGILGDFLKIIPGIFSITE